MQTQPESVQEKEFRVKSTPAELGSAIAHACVHIHM
ncbi:hypothetical protein ABID95_001356 [Streptomyces atratus]